jgi:hypothetical protein
MALADAELISWLAQSIEELLPGLDPAWAARNGKPVGHAKSGLANAKVRLGMVAPDPMAATVAADPQFQAGLERLMEPKAQPKPRQYGVRAVGAVESQPRQPANPAPPQQGPTLRFGKHRARLIADVAAEDPGYLRWVAAQDWCKPELAEQIEQALAR